MNRIEIKGKAKEFAFANKWNIWKPYLVIYAISFVFGFVLALFRIDSTNPVYNLLTTALEIALLPASVGCVYYTINLVKGKNLDVKEALMSKYKFFLPILAVTLLVGIFTALWTLLLIVPGIIYALKMTMVNYLLAEEDLEKVPFKEIMKTSEEMMDGYKMDYFVFCLSFLGWILLSVVTFGIGLIWALPYITVAQVMYYEELKKAKKIKIN